MTATGWRSPRSPSFGSYPRTIEDLRDDPALVVAAQAGDQRALEVLLRRHADRIHAVCRRITGNDSDAADAAQEAMIAIVRSLARFDGRAAFSTWAYRVATNASLDELRRRRRRAEPADDGDLDAAATADRTRVRPAGVDAVDARVDIDAALQTLAPDFRAAVVLRDLVGLDYGEIGEILDVPAGTVKSRIARGRAALADLLMPPGNPTAPADRPRTRP